MNLITFLAGLVSLISLVCAAASPNSLELESFGLEKTVVNRTLITPKTHPSIFSFTGKWLKRRDTFIASNWPGTYTSVLLYGNNATLVLNTLKTGNVTDHKFSYSLDGGKIQEVAIQKYDSNIIQTLELSLKIPKIEIPKNASLAPRVLTLYSHSLTPLRLYGLYVGNVVINDGMDWAGVQRQKPRIEFVTNYNTSPRNIFKELSFTVPEQLGIHHSHITADICLSPDCNPSQYSMMEQFFNFQYYDGVRPKRGVDPKPSVYQYQRRDPFLHLNEPQVLVLDIGDMDMKKKIDPTTYSQDIKKFIASALVHSYSDINHVFVLVRPGRYEQATYKAIQEIPSNRITPVYYGKQTADWWKGFMCSNAIPATGKPFPYDSLCGNKSFTFSTKAVLGHSNVWIMLLGIIAISGAGFYYLKTRKPYQELPVTSKMT